MAAESTVAGSDHIEQWEDDASNINDKPSRNDVAGYFLNKPWRHDVFLSFRGEDTRRNFTSHLFHCLKENGVNVFIDDRLQRGEDISTQLIDTIRNSRISVVVLSLNYADSRWCLEELCEIMECRKTHRHMVLPVFYDVDPSDVRKQKGRFGEVFVAKHQNDKNIARWKAALSEAGSLSGWDITNAASGPEAKIVREIARRICNELNNTYLDIGKYSVGLEHRMERVNTHLNDGSNDVRFIVIWGSGGIGKTTLAKAVYNQFFHSFEAKSFLANIGENSKTTDGLVRLQEQLLYDILKFQKTKVGSIDRGINVIKDSLRTQKVLVVLDDISHRDQLKALARDREWFSPGSRIIITTRDLDTVKEIEAEYVYMLDPMSYDESMRLFSLHAFRRSAPGEEFAELSSAVVSYCEGLPLALEVLGSYFLDLTAGEWKSAVEQLRRAPHDDIQKKLEISYHALADHDKKLFLDIACFFVGWRKDDLVRILEACGLSLELGLRFLSRRSLVKITEWNTVEMHYVIRDMGREIVRKQSPDNPGKRSRLFADSDILTTLRNGLGTKKVEGLVLSSSTQLEEVDAKAFEKMKQLRLLQLCNLHVKGDYGLFTKELRWLCWHGFPLYSLPDELCLEKVAVINIQCSKLRVMWKSSKFLQHLKVLNLSHSHLLKKTPDFSKLPSLEDLILEDCIQLKEVHPSIGCLSKLFSMNLKGCEKLTSLPDSICNVKSLRLLDICGCSKINRLPDNFGELEVLMEFLADGAPIISLPLSFAKLKNLSKLKLHGLKGPGSIAVSTLIWQWILKRSSAMENNRLTIPVSTSRSLTELYLKDCYLDDAGLQSIGSLLSLVELDLQGSSFQHLPSSISSLPNLSEIRVNSCFELVSISDVPPSVQMLYCSNCLRLSDVSCSRNWHPEIQLRLEGCRNLSIQCKESILKDWKGKSLLIPGNDIPVGFEHQSKGRLSLSLQFPTCQKCDVKRIYIACIMRTPDNPRAKPLFPSWFLENKTRGHKTFALWSPGIYLPNKDLIVIFSVDPLEVFGDAQYRGINVALNVESCSYWNVKEIGVHLEQEICRNCKLKDSNANEAGTSCYSPKNEPDDIELETVSEQWLLKVDDIWNTSDFDKESSRRSHIFIDILVFIVIWVVLTYILSYFIHS